MLCQKQGECGVCELGNLGYEKQLEWKVNQLTTNLGRYWQGEWIIEPSPKVTHYRNKMEVVIDAKGGFGLRAKGKWWRVLDKHICVVADKAIEASFYQIYEWLTKTKLKLYNRKLHTGVWRYAVIRSNKKGEVLISMVTSEVKGESEKRQVIKELKELNNMVKPESLVWVVNDSLTDVAWGKVGMIISGPGYITETINGVRFKITPNIFFQINPWVAEKLQDWVVNQIMGDRVLDLYGGSGFFGLKAAKKGYQVKVVEEMTGAVKVGQENAKINQVGQIDFVASRAQDYSWDKVSTIIVDPPRSGLAMEVLRQLLEKPPTQRLIYVSCNYKRLAWELKFLVMKYKIVNMKAFDMFPLTKHVEVGVVMENK